MKRLLAFLLLLPLPLGAVELLPDDKVDTSQEVALLNRNAVRLETGKLNIRPQDVVPKQASTYYLGLSTVPWKGIFSDSATFTSATVTNLTVTTITVNTAIVPGSDSVVLFGASGNEVAQINVDTHVVTTALNVSAVSPSTSPAGNYFYSDNFLKARVTFDGTVASPVSADDVNVSNAITKNATGDYTITFSRAFANTSYTCNINAAAAAGANMGYPVTKLVGSFRFRIARTSTEALADSSIVDVACYGDQ